MSYQIIDKLLEDELKILNGFNVEYLPFHQAYYPFQIINWFRFQWLIHGEINSKYDGYYYTYDEYPLIEDVTDVWRYFYTISWTDCGKDYIRTTRDLDIVTSYEEYEETEIACIKQMIQIFKNECKTNE
jgi:hypothetical protein